MSAVYFPGCKYTIHSRVNSRKIRQYLIRQHGIRQTGCCSTGLDTSAMQIHTKEQRIANQEKL